MSFLIDSMHEIFQSKVMVPVLVSLFVNFLLKPLCTLIVQLLTHVHENRRDYIWSGAVLATINTTLIAVMRLMSSSSSSPMPPPTLVTPTTTTTMPTMVLTPFTQGHASDD